LILYIFHAIQVHKWVYNQQTAQRISLIHLHRRLLQHVSAISYSHPQWALISKGYTVKPLTIVPVTVVRPHVSSALFGPKISPI
jgi:hypothetical protein